MENATELSWRMTGNAAEIADILTQFAEQLRSGDITVWKAQRELHITSDGPIELAVKADSTAIGDADLRIELKWDHDKETSPRH